MPPSRLCIQMQTDASSIDHSILDPSLRGVLAAASLQIGPLHRWRILLRRLELMFWVGPEIIICWAFRQWLGARNLENLYKGELSV